MNEKTMCGYAPCRREGQPSQRINKNMAKPAVSFGENTGLLILRSATARIQA